MCIIVVLLEGGVGVVEVHLEGGRLPRELGDASEVVHGGPDVQRVVADGLLRGQLLDQPAETKR